MAFNLNCQKIILIHLFLLSTLISDAIGSNIKSAWKFNMVHNLRWNTSKNFMFVHRENTISQFHNGRMHIGPHPPKLFEDSEMTFHFFTNRENMLIKFHTEDENNAFCEIGLYPEEVVEQIVAELKNTNAENYHHPGNIMREHCSFQRAIKYQIYPPQEIFNEKLQAFCPMDTVIENKYGEMVRNYPKFMVANEIYNRPSQTPECIYDFHHRATEPDEYNFFKYCAKAYFFQGKDHLDPKRHSEFRKDWLLFLAEGEITCGISGNIAADKALLARGYTVELVHLSDRYRFYPEMRLCPELEATLVKYDDHRKDGAFILAAVVGSAQMDGNFTWKYVKSDVPDQPPNENLSKKLPFWEETTYKDEYKYMLLDERACYLQHHKLMKWNHGPLNGAYRLQLRIKHFCTGRGMLGQTTFDVSVKPNQPPDNIYEDTKIQIDLSKGIMTRTTGQKLCAIEYGNAAGMEDCIKAPEPQKNLQLKEKDECQHSHECGFGMLCRPKESPLVCKVEKSCHDNKKRTCEYFAWRDADTKGVDCNYNDLYCHDDQYCFHASGASKFIAKNECRMLHYRQDDETCVVDEECYPESHCFGATKKHYGQCRKK